MDGLSEFDHPAWLTAIGTAVGYGLILIVLLVLLFALPYLVFTTI